MLRLKLKTAPSQEPVSTATAKSHLRVDVSDDDTLIDNLIKAARQHAEDILGRALITQTWTLWLEGFPGLNEIRLPRPPLQSVTHIKHYDTDDTASTFSTSKYFVDTASEPGRIVLNDGESWPGDTLRPANGVEIEYVAGYGSSGSDVPERVNRAILLMAAHLYEHRGDETADIPVSLDQLLWPLRHHHF